MTIPKLRLIVFSVAAAVVASHTTLAFAGQGAAAAVAPLSATASVELLDPAGDVKPIVYRESVGNGPERDVPYPGFDVVKLGIASDGRVLTFTATLSAAPARASYEVLEFYIDADNNARTGISQPSDKRLTGLEYYGTLEDCLVHPTFGTTCAGAEANPMPHTAMVSIERYGREWMNKETLLTFPAPTPDKQAAMTPVKGAVVQATLPYSAIGARPGQTIKLFVREACAGAMMGPDGFFPPIVLTLK
jgi:fructose-specific component phosphotransferase system IIB-like protein